MEAVIGRARRWWSATRRIDVGGPARIDRLRIAVVAAVAYLPILLQRPGTVVGDTADGVYVAPARALIQGATRWDERISFGAIVDRVDNPAFPMAPFYWLAHGAHIPTWITQRLWFGTIIFLAGLGVLFLTNVMEWVGAGRLLAALSYASCPYVVTLLAVRSVALLAWAALPWLLGITMQALAEPGGRDWRYVARFALVVGVAGGSNVSALCYVLIAPMLWILYATIAVREVSWRRAARFAGRTLLASSAISAWWLVAVLIRPRAEISAVREADPAVLVAAASTPTQAVRGLADWSFVLRPPVGKLDTALAYQRMPLVVAASFVPVIIALGVFARRQFHNRVFFVAMFVAGLAASVGMWPFDAPEAYGRILRTVTNIGFGSLLLPTARAAPLCALAVAIAVGVAVRDVLEQLPDRRRIVRGLGAAVIAAGTPSLFTGQALSTSAAIDRIPGYWRDAARWLDSPEHAGYAVLELPGLSKPIYDWGTMRSPVSQLLVHRSVALRTGDWPDQPPTADLVAAIDDAARTDALPAEAVAPLARLLGVDTILVRFDTPADANAARRVANLLDDAPGIGHPVAFGPTVNGRPALLAYPVERPEPSIRLVPPARSVVVAGTGPSLVGLAADELVGGDEAVLYSATLGDDQFAALPDEVPVVITDLARWTDVSLVGLDPAAEIDTSRFTPAVIVRSDRPSPLPDAAADALTTEQVRGAKSITASGYGAADGIRPEYRPQNAFDGDPATAWRAGVGGDPRGAWIAIELSRPTTSGEVFLTPAGNSPAITKVRIDAGNETFDEVLAPVGRQRLQLPITGPYSTLRVTILGTEAGGSPGAGAGFSEIAIPGVNVVDDVVLPDDTARFAGLDAHPLAIRLRRWAAGTGLAAAPERRIMRSFRLTSERRFTVRALLRSVETDDPIDRDCLAANPLITIDGQPVRLRIGERHLGVDAASGDQLTLGPGSHQVRTALPEDCGVYVDQITLADRVGSVTGPPTPTPPVTVAHRSPTAFQLTVGRTTAPMWLSLGVSYDDDWIGGGLRYLGAPQLVNGFAAGWYLDQPADEAFVFSARWTPQRSINVGVLASIAVCVVLLVAALFPGLARSRPVEVASQRRDRASATAHNVTMLTVLAVFSLTAGAVPAIIAGAAAIAIEVRSEMQRRVAWAAVVLLSAVGVLRIVESVIIGDRDGRDWVTQPRVIEALVWTALGLTVTAALAYTDRPNGRRY